MKNISAIIIMLIASALFTGCGLHEFKAGDPLLALEQSKETSKTACYAAQEKNKIDTSGLSELGKVMLLQQQSYERMVSAFTGKSFDPCSSGTNINDVLIADSTNRNQTARTIAGTVGSVATTGIIAAGVVAGVESIGENSGVKTFGDNSPATKTSTKNRTSATATNAGDGSASTSPGLSADPVVTEPPIDIDPIDIDPIVVTPE
jgi:hypothetical protein